MSGQESLTPAASSMRDVCVDYGCLECLRGHEGPLGIVACPHCGGLTDVMPANEQPTVEARRAVAWATRRDLPDPDYACGAAFCDDPACTTHAKGNGDD